MDTAISWSEKYSVGVRILDEHHQQLFALMDKLHSALKERRGREVVGDILKELLDYTAYHFSEEEKLMSRAHCNGMVAHKQMHSVFIAELEGYKDKADAGMEAFITTSLMIKLNDWLITHIGRVDQLYSDRMHNAGIR